MKLKWTLGMLGEVDERYRVIELIRHVEIL